MIIQINETKAIKSFLINETKNLKCYATNLYPTLKLLPRQQEATTISFFRFYIFDIF